MSDGYFRIANTDSVRAAQAKYGSRRARARSDRHVAGLDAPEPRDALTTDERDFLSTLDGFFVASVSETGWPYLQFRGGPSGFLVTPDEHTIAWADFRGNRQYISIGNIDADARVAMIFLDYPTQTRLKVYGRAEVVDVRDEPELAASLAIPGYRAVVERAVSVTVVSYDWNCPQHITPRYTSAELTAAFGPGWAERARRTSDQGSPTAEGEPRD